RGTRRPRGRLPTHAPGAARSIRRRESVPASARSRLRTEPKTIRSRAGMVSDGVPLRGDGMDRQVSTADGESSRAASSEPAGGGAQAPGGGGVGSLLTENYFQTREKLLTRRGVLWLGQTCNIRCHFCYFLDRIENKEHPEHQFMDLEKAKRICHTLRYKY